eukprot:Clim_evm21s215 gene=Clim_evmTU21s215
MNQCTAPSGQKIEVHVYDGVEDLSAVKKEIMTGTYKRCGLVNAKHIISLDHLMSGAVSALLREECNEMVTRAIGTELLYVLMPEKQITAALKELGLDRSGGNLFLVGMNAGPSEIEKLEDVLRKAGGKKGSIEDFAAERGGPDGLSKCNSDLNYVGVASGAPLYTHYYRDLATDVKASAGNAWQVADYERYVTSCNAVKDHL